MEFLAAPLLEVLLTLQEVVQLQAMPQEVVQLQAQALVMLELKSRSHQFTSAAEFLAAPLLAENQADLLQATLQDLEKSQVESISVFTSRAVLRLTPDLRDQKVS